YHAQKAFISIGKTVQTAGFHNVEQYHTNVPSFGEWGWTIATKNGQPASIRIRQSGELPVDLRWATKKIIEQAFVFPKNYYKNANNIGVNTLNSYTLYQYHQEAWKLREGVLNFQDE
ncbi:MAG: spermidine synthase, partial [Gammaproteobacteria bacterium]|nr:spermidine synthase [Gammaproteobacteria bacterium]